ncbi:MAG: hypothetical protein KGJ40_05400 [candidate division NC10 bacterium]|nr:hypothetical protein [candidate division NC10 bacterium]
MNRSRRTSTTAYIAGLFALLLLSAPPDAFAQAGARPPLFAPATTTGDLGTSAGPGGTSGMMIYIDPKTGAFLKEPAPGYEPLRLTPQLQNAFSTSDSGLVEVPSSVPGGGVLLDLQGRFQSPVVITIDANGKVKMQHLNETSETRDKK